MKFLPMLVLALPIGLTTCDGQGMRPQVPCPVLLVSGKVTRGDLEFSFMNKGKMPIEELSMGCSPRLAGQTRDAICHRERGLFYPGQRYTVTFPYAGGLQGAVVLTVRAAELGDGSRWIARSATACRPLRILRAR